MTTTPTYAQIANDFRLWQEYVDPSGNDDKARFDAMTVEQKLNILAECFGPEEEI